MPIAAFFLKNLAVLHVLRAGAVLILGEPALRGRSEQLLVNLLLEQLRFEKHFFLSLARGVLSVLWLRHIVIIADEDFGLFWAGLRQGLLVVDFREELVLQVIGFQIFLFSQQEQLFIVQLE